MINSFYLVAFLLKLIYYKNKGKPIPLFFREISRPALEEYVLRITIPALLS